MAGEEERAMMAVVGDISMCGETGTDDLASCP